MAQIFSADPVTDGPSTPTKAGLGDSTIETAMVSPSSAPPKYETKRPELDHGIITGHGPLSQFKPEHPILPVGDIFYDIRNHLKCYNIFNNNVEALLGQFLVMKGDLERSRAREANLERALRRERDEKESLRRENQILRSDLIAAQDDLQTARADLAASQANLAQAIAQLAEAGNRLEKARTDLRAVTRERDHLQGLLADKERQIEYYMQRDKALKLALQQANAGENAANDRNTRLTQLLYELEAQKARIERRADQAEERVRYLDRIIRELETPIRITGGPALGVGDESEASAGEEAPADTKVATAAAEDVTANAENEEEVESDRIPPMNPGDQLVGVAA